MTAPKAPRRTVVALPDRSPPFVVERTLLQEGRLRVEITRRPDSFTRALTVTRTRSDGRESSFTLFPGEWDDVIDALCDGADAIEPPE